jgi:hypothetical protein
MRDFSFAECRARFDIGPGFSDDNVIATDGSLEELPQLRLVRHGNAKVEVSGVRVEIARSARGAISIFVGEGGSVVRIGPETLCNVNIRLWRKPLVEIGARTTLLMAWMPPPDGIAMCHCGEC